MEFGWGAEGSPRVPVDLGDPSFLLREIRSPLALCGASRDSSCIAAGMNRASSLLMPESQDSSPFLTLITGSLQIWNRRVRPRLVLRNGAPLASLVVHGVSDHLSRCIWNLWLFPDDETGLSVPLHVVISSSGYIRRGTWDLS